MHKTVKFLGIQCVTLKLLSQFHGVKFLGIQHMSMKCSYYLLFLGIHIKGTQKYSVSQCKMEGQEEPLSDTDTPSSTDLELVSLDNLRCFQPSSQPSASQPSSQTSASTSTAPPSPSRLLTYSSKQKRLQVTRCAKGTVEDTALFTSSTFVEQCYHIIQFLCSPEIDRCFPDYLNDKHARQNFKRKAERYKWDETR